MISEKSLELNVTENLLRELRKYMQFNNAFSYGLTLRQEAAIGLDISINLPSQARVFGLQFKKPISCKYNQIYRFKINNNIKRDQHLKLYYLSLIFHYIFQRDFIYYSFPCFFDTKQLASSSPNFLKRTFFVNPRVMPIRILDTNIHVVQIDSISARVDIFSNFGKEIEVIRGDKFIENILRQESFIEVGTLMEKCKRIEKKYLIKVLEESKAQPILFKLLEENWYIRIRCIAL